MGLQICDSCGNSFDPADAEVLFNIEEPLLDYSCFIRCLCSNCAVQAIKDEVTDTYEETCISCGKKFDLGSDQCEFAAEYDASLSEFWEEGPLCFECAQEKYLDKYPNG